MIDTLHSYAAVLFDFDGTLADSYGAIAASVNHVRGLRGLPALSVDDVKRYVGRGAAYLLTQTVPGGRLADDMAAYYVHYSSVMLALTHLLPGAAALLAALHRQGKKLGLCSNKPRQFSQRLLEHLGVAAYFGAVLGPEDVPSPKPAPDMLVRAIDRLGVTHDQALYVGDNLVDIQAARSAGVQIWAVPTGSWERANLEAAKPDRLLTDLQEMVAEIERKP